MCRCTDARAPPEADWASARPVKTSSHGRNRSARESLAERTVSLAWRWRAASAFSCATSARETKYIGPAGHRNDGERNARYSGRRRGAPGMAGTFCKIERPNEMPAATRAAPRIVRALGASFWPYQTAVGVQVTPEALCPCSAAAVLFGKPHRPGLHGVPVESLHGPPKHRRRPPVLSEAGLGR